MNETDEAAIHVERGRVPDLKGLSTKAAIQRVLMVGGLPKVVIVPGGSLAPRVVEQLPAGGAKLEDGSVVTIKVGGT
jgi:beta-lactam-binding protein with PASTA domain